MGLVNVNIEKELNNERKNSLSSETLKEAKLLLEGNVLEEREILRNAGLDHNIIQLEKEMGINLEREKLEKNMNNSVFSETEIKEMCLKYRLRFLRSNNYKGKVDPVLGAKILRFFKEKNIDGKNFEAESNLYIMAPAKAFNLSKIPKPQKVDPVLFYKISTKEGESMYAIIHKWGNDFTLYRRLLGMIFKNQYNWLTAMVVLSGIVGSIISSLFGFHPLHPGFIFGTGAVGLVVTLVSIAFNVEDSKARYFSRFTETNWNDTHTH